MSEVQKKTEDDEILDMICEEQETMQVLREGFEMHAKEHRNFIWLDGSKVPADFKLNTEVANGRDGSVRFDIIAPIEQVDQEAQGDRNRFMIEIKDTFTRAGFEVVTTGRTLNSDTLEDQGYYHLAFKANDNLDGMIFMIKANDILCNKHEAKEALTSIHDVKPIEEADPSLWSKEAKRQQKIVGEIISYKARHSSPKP